MQPPPKLTTHLVRIETYARGVMQGDIGMTEFEALIVQLETLFAQNLVEVREIAIPPEFMAEIADEMDIGQRGIELYLDAMADFREYIRNRTVEPMQRGLTKARQANEMVNQALTRNWATYYTYLQAAQEYLNELEPGAPPAPD